MCQNISVIISDRVSSIILRDYGHLLIRITHPTTTTAAAATADQVKNYLNACTPVMARPSTSPWISYVPSYVFTVSRLTRCLIMWYSSLMPLPPSVSRAILAISSALPVELRLISDTISGVASPNSLSRPTCRHANNPIDISVTMSAYFFWISCVPASGLPNCFRSKQYNRDADRHASAAPNAPHAIP